MVYGWLRRVSNTKEKKRGRHPPASRCYMGSGLHAKTGCRKVYAEEVFG